MNFLILLDNLPIWAILFVVANFASETFLDRTIIKSFRFFLKKSLKLLKNSIFLTIL